MTHTCISLFSGGLDSLLAIAVLAKQEIDVIAFYGTSVFTPRSDTDEGRAQARKMALSAGARDIVFRDQTEAMIAFTKSPRCGYGKHLNACLDCRMMTLANGKAVMDEHGADFLATGEVVGQRPMSQRRDAMRRVDKFIGEIGLEGRVLRPLSAKILEPTRPETLGWVDRERLHGFSGRTRKPQMELAEAFGITEYETPAGGCLLTDGGFCTRLHDLMAHRPDWGAKDVRLLKIGRHFRVGPDTVLVASRREEENNALSALAGPEDRLFITRDRPGAIVMLRGKATDPFSMLAAGLAVHYSKHRPEGRAAVRSWRGGEDRPESAVLEDVPRMDPDHVRSMWPPDDAPESA